MLSVVPGRASAIFNLEYPQSVVVVLHCSEILGLLSYFVCVFPSLHLFLNIN